VSSPLVAGLRSVALDVPDLAFAGDFYTRVWHLDVAARTAGALYLRGTGPAHHLLSLHAAERVAIRNVTFSARGVASLQAIADRCATVDGARVLAPIAASDDPAGGTALTIADADGRIFRIVHGDATHADAHEARDRPVRLAHAVLNSHDVAASQSFLERVFGFRLADRTRIMAFMNCNDDHHSIAFGDADNDALNHIAFLMPDLESVMRGGGRMRDAGYPIEWGPGRHGPGDNAFNYFVGPFDVVIEYTAGVEQIDDRYQARGPDDWKWPPGRVDQWGISAPPSARLKQAQRAIHFLSA
jgi:catechol-2,3-dioxygenase